MVVKLRLEIEVGKGRPLRLVPDETIPLQWTFQRGATSIAASENQLFKHLTFCIGVGVDVGTSTSTSTSIIKVNTSSKMAAEQL